MNRLFLKIIIAATVGFLFAGAFTHVIYPCQPVDGAAGCISFEKAITHPSDLLANEQNSLVDFSVKFVVAGLVSFGLLSILARAEKTKPARE